MNAQPQSAGGFFAGKILIAGILYGLVVAPKKEGEHKDAIWIPRYKDVPNARSFNDGLANTDAMAAAGSKIATWARELTIGGHTDWYIPSQDELEICYRAFKPTTNEDSHYARSGINLHASPPTLPYSHAPAVQAEDELFRESGSEAFDTVWYWSSTQHASYSYYAWGQDFDGGGQDGLGKGYSYRVRAVRRFPI